MSGTHEAPRTPRSIAGDEHGHTDSSRSPILVTSDEACELLRIGTQTLSKLQRIDAIPAKRIGRAVRFCTLELKAWTALGCPDQPGDADEARKLARDWRAALGGEGVRR